jgi:hypothetical protein
VLAFISGSLSLVSHIILVIFMKWASAGHHNACSRCSLAHYDGAGEEIRTLDLFLGKEAL